MADEARWLYLKRRVPGWQRQEPSRHEPCSATAARCRLDAGGLAHAATLPGRRLTEKEGADGMMKAAVR